MPDNALPAPGSVVLQVGAAFGWMGVIQETLWAHREGLSEAGLLYVRDYPNEDFHASLDLRRAPAALRDMPVVAGTWAQAARRARQHDGIAVLSHGTLGQTRGADVRHALALLEPADVHVVFTTQDVVQQGYMKWQQQLLNRETRTFTEFLDDLTADAAGPPIQEFWSMQDPVAVLADWADVVPADRIHIVTLPRVEDPGGLAWSRFAGLVGLNPDDYAVTGRRGTALLQAADAELLRSVNADLPDSFGPPAYRRLVQGLLAGRLLRRESAANIAPSPTAEQSTWFDERSGQMVEKLRSNGYDVVGDLQDLVPNPEITTDRHADTDLLDAGLKASATLLERMRDARIRIDKAERELTTLRHD